MLKYHQTNQDGNASTESGAFYPMETEAEEMTARVPKEIDNLKKYAKGVLDEKETFQNFEKSLHGESDRAIVILAGTMVEDALKWRLQKNMIKLNAMLRSELFGPLKPLGSFSSMISLAHALGIVAPKHAKKLHILREIRNQCAHSHSYMSFEAEELERAARLLIPDEFDVKLPESRRDKAVARDQFLSSAMFFAYMLYTDVESAVKAAKYFLEEE